MWIWFVILNMRIWLLIVIMRIWLLLVNMRIWLLIIFLNRFTLQVSGGILQSMILECYRWSVIHSPAFSVENLSKRSSYKWPIYMNC